MPGNLWQANDMDLQESDARNNVSQVLQHFPDHFILKGNEK